MFVLRSNLRHTQKKHNYNKPGWSLNILCLCLRICMKRRANVWKICRRWGSPLVSFCRRSPWAPNTLSWEGLDTGASQQFHLMWISLLVSFLSMCFCYDFAHHFIISFLCFILLFCKWRHFFACVFLWNISWTSEKILIKP